MRGKSGSLQQDNPGRMLHGCYRGSCFQAVAGPDRSGRRSRSIRSESGEPDAPAEDSPGVTYSCSQAGAGAERIEREADPVGSGSGSGPGILGSGVRPRSKTATRNPTTATTAIIWKLVCTPLANECRTISSIVGDRLARQLGECGGGAVGAGEISVEDGLLVAGERESDLRLARDRRARSRTRW